MKHSKKISNGLMIALLALANGVAAQVLTTPIPDALWLQTDEATQNTVGPVPVGNSLSTPNPSWAISQWFGPVAFPYPYNTIPYGSYTSDGNNWTLANASTAVSYNNTLAPWLNGVYSLAQNGNPNSNSPGQSCGSESNLFLAPKSNLNTLSPYGGNSPNGLVNSSPLSQLSNLSINLGINVTGVNVGPECGGDPNASRVTFIVGFIIHNNSNNSNFFYQIVFYDSNPQVASGGQWVDAHGNFGVDDDIRAINSYLQRPSPGAGRMTYSMSIFSRLSSIIQSKSPDPDLSHYQLAGAYIGQQLWGRAVGNSQWDNFNIVAAP